MSGSYYRPKPTTLDNTVIPYRETQRAYDRVRSPWVDSRDALDLSAELIEAAGDIGASGNTLWNYPTNEGAIRDARAAARRVLALCLRIEEIAK